MPLNPIKAIVNPIKTIVKSHEITVKSAMFHSFLGHLPIALRFHKFTRPLELQLPSPPCPRHGDGDYIGIINGMIVNCPHFIEWYDITNYIVLSSPYYNLHIFLIYNYSNNPHDNN